MARLSLIGVLVLGLIASVAVAAEPAVKRENIEWTQIWIPDLEQTNLPRVLLVGDSICNAYYEGVKAELQGKAYVAKLATSSSLGDPILLDQVKMLVSNYKFAVIHFNNGLHGMDYTDEEYAKAIPKLLAIFKQCAPEAKLVWATSTPMREPAPNLDKFHAENKIVIARNEIVRAIAAKEGILVDDLYPLVENHPEFWSNDGTHYNADGQAVEAKQVAKCVLDVLPK